MLSGRSVKITKIRTDDQSPGLRDYEASFLRLIDKLTDGSRIIINETGTQLRFDPGQLVGCKDRVSHDCPKSRSVVYFLDALILLLPFSRNMVKIKFTNCITADNYDISVDSFKAVSIPLLKHFGVAGDNLVVKQTRRGVPPLGGGEVLFSCPIIPRVRPVNLMEEGRIRRVRGVAFTNGVTPQFANQVVEKVKEVLNPMLNDVWVFTDHTKGGKNPDGTPMKIPQSPGYGVSLVAETTTGCLKSIDVFSGNDDTIKKNDSPYRQILDPHTVGEVAAYKLLHEINFDGVCDNHHQILLIHYLALAEEDEASRVRLGRLSPTAVAYLRHVRDFFGVKFRIVQEMPKIGENDEDGDDDDDMGVAPEPSVVLSCVGVGLANISKPTF